MKTLLLILMTMISCSACGKSDTDGNGGGGGTGGGSSLNDNDFDKIIVNIVQKERKTQSDKLTDINNRTTSYLKLIDKSGCFTDIDYTDKSFTSWTPIKHVERLKDMAYSYTTSDGTYYKNEQCYTAIVNGLEAWYTKKSKSDNWWYNQIDSPQKLGLALVLMRAGSKKVPAATEAKLLSHMKTTGGDPRKSTGANKSDISIHWIYQGCLAKSNDIMKVAIEQVFDPLKFTTEEGLQYDYSYFQHNRQLYIGGYGQVFVKGIVDAAMYFKDTSVGMTDEQLDLFGSFVCKTYLQTVRGQCMLFNVCGRSVSRVNVIRQDDLPEILTSLKTIDPSNSEQYDNAIKRITESVAAGYKVSSANTHYYIGDYSLHQRPVYTFGIRLVSSRTYRSEEGNEENIKGYFISDGSTAITVNGDEYFNIFPTWDWARVPGVTCPQFTNIPRMTAWGQFGESQFTGGVSNGAYSASVYNMNNNSNGVNTSAKKSWFFFDKEIVCLGSGIRTGTALSVNTTVDQCLSKGNVSVSRSSAVSVVSKGSEVSGEDLQWVHNGNVGYFFPDGGKLSVSDKTRSGSWYDINKTQSSAQVTNDVMTLWFDHGTNPDGAEYSYVVVPGIKTASQMTEYSLGDIEILSNSEKVQAVRHKASGIVQIIFYEAGTLTGYNIEVAANKKCAVMILNNGSKTELYVCDPSQKESSAQIKVKLDGGTEKSANITFPTGVKTAGSTVKTEI